MTQVYFMRPVGCEGPVKIGFSRLPDTRLAIYMKWSPFDLEIAASIPCDQRDELRFHAAFAAHHMHHEWFAAAPEISATIEAIRNGTFCLESLPAPKRLTGKSGWTPESKDAARIQRRLSRLVHHGVSIPQYVSDAQYPDNLSPEGKAKCRAIVRDFVINAETNVLVGKPLPPVKVSAAKLATFTELALREKETCDG